LIMKTTERNIVQINQTQDPYEVSRDGDWLVVPVVMMTEGVRSGSAGPILHQPQYYSQNPQDWNGIPVTANHPRSDGNFVSVNDVSQDQWIVGHLRNAHVEDQKLKAECYIHEQRAIAVNPEILNYIEEGRKIDVSIGAFTQDQPEMGSYGSQEYQAVTVAYHPDHLAILPGSEGACSWDDGCGIRTNKDESKTGDSMDEYFQALKDAAKNGEGVHDGLQDNQLGFMELSSKIQNKLGRMDSDIRVHFLKEVYDEVFVYKVRNRDSGEENFYRLEYNVMDSEEVEFIGEPTQVQRQVEFVPMQSNQKNDGCGCDDSTSMQRTKFNNNTNEGKEVNLMSDNKNKQPSSEAVTKVVSLINNERTNFSESDRDWLLTLNESQLNKLEPKEAPEPEVNKEQAVEALSEELSSYEELLDIVSDDVKEKVELGMKSYNNVREQLIKTIQSNTSEEDWPEDELQDMETSVLQKLAKTVKPVDYSGQGPTNNGSPQSNGQETETLLPAGVQANQE